VDLLEQPDKRDEFFEISPEGRIPAIIRNGEISIGFGGT
jgi:hypothetical protein